MFTVVLYQPEIPPNTGNIIRLCANTGCSLHLVKPLGFPLDSSKMKRAGLDYHEFARLTVHENWEECMQALADKAAFQAGDVFVFGPETRGLPAEILDTLPENQKIRFPMLPDNRSMNLSNTVAVTVFEAWRQQNYAGGV